MSLTVPNTRLLLPNGGAWLIPIGWRPTSENPEPCPFCKTAVLWTETPRGWSMPVEQDGTVHHGCWRRG